VSSGAYAAFRRALERRHLAQALAAAHDLPAVSLADALELVLLAADRDPPTYDRAAARWLARYSLEHRGVDLAETGLAHAALTAIRHTTRRRAGLVLLLALAKERQTRDLASVLERALRTNRGQGYPEKEPPPPPSTV
jgi:hypothetical protein